MDLTLSAPFSASRSWNGCFVLCNGSGSVTPSSFRLLRQTLLAMRSEAERMRRIADFLPGYLQRRRRVQHTKDVAGRNGHARKSEEPS